MGGGGMLRAAGRAVGAGVGSVKNAVAGASGGARVSAGKPGRVGCANASTSPASLVAAEVGMEQWEYVGEEYDDVALFDTNGFGLSERVVFGVPPSKEEVEDAISTIQQIIVPVAFSHYEKGESQDYVHQNDQVEDDLERNSSTENCAESKSDWIEPEMMFYSSSCLQHDGRGKVWDAFRLLQTNPSVQRMVVSLSSDKDVWDAVMKNEVVQELKKSVCNDASDANVTEKDDGTPTGIFQWLFDQSRAKVTEFIEKIMQMMNQICHRGTKEGETEKNDIFNDVVASSFMLSVMVFIVVVITRVHKA